MNILIVGKSGVGKSNLGDIVKNTIFKLDADATINSDDPDRAVKSLGKGNNKYSISIKQLKEGANLHDMFSEELLQGDVIILLTNQKFQEWFRTVYNK